MSGAGSEASQYVVLEPGRPLFLKHSDVFWQVWEGKVEIYAVSEVFPQRRQQVFLFSAETGQPLFGLPDDAGIQLMAISPRGAELKTMSREALLARAENGGRHLFEVIWFMVEEWLEALLPGPDRIALPRVFSLIGIGDELAATCGQAVRCGRRMLWVQRLSGEVRYGRLPEYELEPNRLIPLVFHSWLTPISPGRLAGVSTEVAFSLSNARDSKNFWRSLDDSHRWFAALMRQYFTDELERDCRRLSGRRLQRQQLLQNAAVHLLQSDMPEARLWVTEEPELSPLLAAIRAVARSLGVMDGELKLPAEFSQQDEESLLLRIARQGGMQCRKVTLESGWDKRDNGPMLAFSLKGRQPVALLPASPQKYQVYYPGNPAISALSHQEASAFTGGNAYVFYAGLPLNAVGITGWLKFSLRNIWVSDAWTIILTSLVAATIPLITPLVTETIFSDLIPIQDRQGYAMVIQVMFIAAITSAGIAFARGIAVMRVKYHIRQRGESAIWMRLLSLPTAFFRQFEAGDLAQRMNGFVAISAALSNSLVFTVVNGILSIFSLLMMCWYSWKLGLTALAFLSVYALVAGGLSWRIVHYKRLMHAAGGKVAGRLLQVLNGLTKFRMQGSETQAFYLWAKDFGEEWKWNRCIRWKNNGLEVINNLQPILLTMLMFGMTMHWLEVSDKEKTIFITQASFLGFNAAMAGFNVAITGMLPVLTRLFDVLPLIERLRPVLEAEPEITETKIEAGALTGLIEFSNLSFRYAPDKPLVLKGISLKILPGQFIAIVGSSGSGKSTLLRLLLGFEKPGLGAVYFDGQDLAELKPASVRSQMGVVLQNGQLMAGDIFSNIVGSLPLTMEDAWIAAEMAGLAEDVRTMPMGMHTMISEGASNISGGQRQRILIARAIVQRPRIIVFDEATSALDNRTQAIVTESLDRLKATRIVVAHRLSTICNADLICVLDNGRLVESGTYDELMNQNGVFVELAKRQMS